MKPETLRAAVIWIFRITAVVMMLNGLWMMGSAFHWFTNIPAGLPDTGPPNGHLIRDVGLCYLIFGAGAFWSCGALAARRIAFVGAALFSAGHALGHVVEMLVGALPHSHWLIDLPLVLAPGALFAFFALPAPWRWLTQKN